MAMQPMIITVISCVGSTAIVYRFLVFCGKTVYRTAKDNASDVRRQGDYSGSARSRGDVSMVGLDRSRRKDKKRTRR
jgi:hypothetical protein